MDRLPASFFQRDVLDVAPALLGTRLVVWQNGQSVAYQITETEAYRGEEDQACHARVGKTSRTQIMYQQGGFIYVYLIYGMYWMLNIVTGQQGQPQAVLIRGIEGYNGPGKLTRELQIDNSYYGENLLISKRIWLTGFLENVRHIAAPRIGIDYAGEEWKNKPWRFTLL